MKKAIIIPNTLKESSVEFAPRAAAFLKENGYDAKIVTSIDNDLEASFAVVLGGDGTILRAARQLYGKNIPIFGINFGNLGYLTECSAEDATEGLVRLVNGSYRVESRMMLEGEIVRGNETVSSFIALNEVCTYRATLMHALCAQLKINGNYTETVRGDGLIISTPTGSTSYNLSAGGPILTPTSRNIVITPVAAHTLSNPSIVTDGTDKASVSVSFGSPDDMGCACLEVDGYERHQLCDGDVINVRCAEHDAKIIKVTDKSFYQILREKLYKID
jgi:NAD+ kinase